jgi:hypothetical protein
MTHEFDCHCKGVLLVSKLRTGSAHKAPVKHRASSAGGLWRNTPKCDPAIEPPRDCTQKVTPVLLSRSSKGPTAPEGDPGGLATVIQDWKKWRPLRINLQPGICPKILHNFRRSVA